jgi:hypothetical protein
MRIRQFYNKIDRFLFLTATIALATLILLNWTILTHAQTGIATATPVTASSGRPSTLQVKQQILTLQQKQLQSALADIQRCLVQASEPTTLRDPQGNFNLVPQTDLVNCTRELRTLQRQITALARAASQLGSDAQAKAAFLQRQADDIARNARIRAGTQTGQ